MKSNCYGFYLFLFVYFLTDIMNNIDKVQNSLIL